MIGNCIVGNTSNQQKKQYDDDTHKETSRERERKRSMLKNGRD